MKVISNVAKKLLYKSSTICLEKMILVTGLTGLVGSGFMYHIKNDAALCGQIVALCRESSITEYIEPYCTIERGSSYDEELLDRLCDKYQFDTLIHISNKFQLVQFARLAAKHDIKKVIMVSSTYACSRAHPDNSQLAIENEAAAIMREKNVEYIFLRPTSVFGTRPDGIKDKNMSVFRKYVKKLWLFPLFARGKATVRPMWGADVGQALYLCFTHFETLKNQALICSGDKTRSFKELITLLGEVEGKKVHFLYVPGWLARTFFYCLYYLSGKKNDYREKVDRLLEDKAFDTSDALLKLGYQAHPLKQSLMRIEYNNLLIGLR